MVRASRIAAAAELVGEPVLGAAVLLRQRSARGRAFLVLGAVVGVLIIFFGELRGGGVLAAGLGGGVIGAGMTAGREARMLVRTPRGLLLLASSAWTGKPARVLGWVDPSTIKVGQGWGSRPVELGGERHSAPAGSVKSLEALLAAGTGAPPQ